jgi:hypothetical protein
MPAPKIHVNVDMSGSTWIHITAPCATCDRARRPLVPKSCPPRMSHGSWCTRPVSTRSLTQHVRSCYSHGQADVRMAVTDLMPPNRTTPWAGASPRHSQLRLRTVRSLRPHRYPPFPERSSQVMIISTAVTRRPEQPTPKPSSRTRSVHRSMHLFSLAMMTDVPRNPTTHFLRCRPRSMRRGASTCFLPPTQGRRQL